ncbi:3-demethylubiquinone-9 3-methyltransferase domain protein [Neorhizobium galegae bv. officinalis bv. officinalis str. HAMBI 1141]|jgi:predicted 3-demethylubiquinone-9 3-methyltransferase (glyoxalase superfamily)|uniref:3-demethylubiquinone-9 3-methyltransferase domain protein n=1 Tax=Neorhizobium galegae bv. officinalis bv. officinalis str. HAMBI 1141 TaxID=1028801 RepID=A0A068TFA2_NEOGA|nr:MULTISPECIES: VOC family protein [Neorhizobium]MCJ9668937.1 VOC family protein [Neorhizobium sp. SHOUNA12B]MCJ9743450.1 VOC family protein [Neorhizobium sp. SHOUNA12A]MCJ9751102.1 VOC family protein [Neorhizobium sp. BETTINA12A]CDN56746.1 3-demethylubiquinone-9 3-methyltransferase domain protein [Neorhizobium galegae bv. officinalis bv. officinalis str. HAMBI 1141]
MNIYPHLWFNGQAEEAMEFYRSVFKDSRLLARTELPNPELSVVRFELGGLQIAALNANSRVPYNEAFSFLVETGDQEETDYYWNALIADGGKEQPCGWLTDKFGVYWQVTPAILLKMIADADKDKAERVMQAMYRMKKIIIADLERAYQG